MNLIPLDGKFDELKEEFEADIKDIIGGREYKIVVIVKNLAGNENTVEIKTPYIRQFENFGKQLYEKGIIIGSSYYTWYRHTVNNWKDGYKYSPLLGEYSSSDEVVINKHVDIATGFGINLFLISWNGPETENTQTFEKDFLNAYLVKRGDILISILYESGARLKNSGLPTAEIYDFADPQNQNVFLSDIEYMKIRYFNLPNFLKISGKPFIYFYASNAYRGPFDEIIQKAKQQANIFACGSDITPYIQPHEVNEIEKRIKTFDAERSWVALWVQNDPDYPKNYEEIIKIKYKEWHEFLSQYNRTFIPTVITSFDSRYVVWGAKDQYPLEKNIERFKNRMEIILPYVKMSNFLFIDTWNDWFEGTNIEPSREHGFEELEVLKAFLSTLLQNNR